MAPKWAQQLNRVIQHVLENASLVFFSDFWLEVRELQGVSGETFSGKLDLKENLGQVIQTIGEASNFFAEYQTDKIILASTKLNLKDTVPMK